MISCPCVLHRKERNSRDLLELHNKSCQNNKQRIESRENNHKNSLALLHAALQTTCLTMGIILKAIPPGDGDTVWKLQRGARFLSSLHQRNVTYRKSYFALLGYLAWLPQCTNLGLNLQE